VIDCYAKPLASQVLLSSCTTITLFIVNGTMSGVLVFRDYFAGFRTGTVQNGELFMVARCRIDS